MIKQPSTVREMVTSVEKMEQDGEAKRRKLNVAGINEKSQKYLKQLKGTILSSLLNCQQELHRRALTTLILGYFDLWQLSPT